MDNFFEIIEKHMIGITFIVACIFFGIIAIMPFYFVSKRDQVTIEAIKAGLVQNAMFSELQKCGAAPSSRFLRMAFSAACHSVGIQLYMGEENELSKAT